MKFEIKETKPVITTILALEIAKKMLLKNLIK